MNDNFDSAALSVSPRLRKILGELSAEIKNTTYEIRLRAERPLTLIGKYGTVFIRENATCSGKPSPECVKVSSEEIRDTFNRICSDVKRPHRDSVRPQFIFLVSVVRSQK